MHNESNLSKWKVSYEELPNNFEGSSGFSVLHYSRSWLGRYSTRVLQLFKDRLVRKSKVM